MKEEDIIKQKRMLYIEKSIDEFSIELFGDEIAKRENYKQNHGISAIHFYLVQKYKWLPSVVMSMNHNDLRFLLSEEMSSWTLSEDAAECVRSWQSACNTL